ncbi:GNAT family N-acetyltransferase [Rubrobacter xylanophilus]|nr:GNAT family protein [Rubrobacter xylanophilus]
MTQEGYLLRGPRFGIRRIQERDIDLIGGWIFDPELSPEYIARADPEEAEQMDVRALLTPSDEDPGPFYFLALVADDAVGEQVAFVNFLSKNGPPHYLWEGEILVGRRPDGAKGVGTEVFALAIEVLFSETPAQKLWGPIATDNTASLRMAERLGFKWEGFLRQHIPMASGVKDARLGSVLKSEWELPFKLDREEHV